MRDRTLPRSLVVTALVLCGVLAVGCRQDMHDQAKYEPFEENDFFANGMASRSLVANTIPRGFLFEDTAFHTGLDDAGEPLTGFPFEVTEEVMLRGRQRFEIFCTPCHGRLGSGNGMIVQRGFKEPTSFHEERLRTSPPGYFVNVMTEGFGVMSSYAPQVPAKDRWAVAAYIRALQLSQHARRAELDAEDQRKVQESLLPAVPAEGGDDHHAGES